MKQAWNFFVSKTIVKSQACYNAVRKILSHRTLRFRDSNLSKCVTVVTTFTVVDFVLKLEMMKMIEISNINYDR